SLLPAGRAASPRDPLGAPLRRRWELAVSRSRPRSETRRRRNLAYAVARRRASADFLRAAVLRGITPLLTALSSPRMASRMAAGRADASAARAVFTDPRIFERIARFRRRRRSLCRMRFIADFVFAT